MLNWFLNLADALWIRKLVKDTKTGTSEKFVKDFLRKMLFTRTSLRASNQSGNVQSSQETTLYTKDQWT